MKAALLIDEGKSLPVEETAILVWEDCNGKTHQEQMHTVLGMLDSAEEIEHRCRIPWHKPDETPAPGEDCIVKVPGMIGNMLTFIAMTLPDEPKVFYSDDCARIPMEVVHCWMYAHELPVSIPGWVKK